MVRDHVSMAAPVTGPGPSSRAQRPHCWLRGGGLWDLCMVACFPEGPYKLRILISSSVGVSSNSPQPFWVLVSLDRQDPYGESLATGARPPGSNPRPPLLSCLTLGKVLGLCTLVSLSRNADNKNTYLRGLRWILS